MANNREKCKINEMIRIDHAGEYAAKRIYEGQLDYIKDKDSKEKIQEMAKGEEKHLAYFEEQLRARKARPTLLFPLVDKLAYSVGAVTAMMGKESAMVCTSAVEDVIAEHYSKQIEGLDDKNSDLRDNIREFREEELEHKHIAEEYELRRAPGHKVLNGIIKGGCKVAIKLVKYL
ncbi:MAG: demethoxyubiquinone hydroxylase family protein [Alphaproteobacteria bacterium]|nr:demethoxyubiquinone hydroxylase family protein [Alphaproteobacteria bacterium]